MSKNHALVIGGTGMLSDVTLWLTKHYQHTSVIGRQKAKYHDLLKKVDHPKSLSSILVDYHDEAQLKEKLEESIKENGAFDLVIAWVHSTASQVIPNLMEVLDETNGHSYDLYHVKSSSAYFEDNEWDVTKSHHVHEIFLGYKVINHHSRWLTHKEISNGVIDSIQHNRPQTIVGQIEPWNQRPS